MADVVLKNIKKVYPNIEPKKKKKGEPEKEKKNNLLVTEEGVLAVHDFNLEIKDNEFIVLVGPSGCGKSTTLRMIAGLEEISGGELYIDGKLMNDIPPKDRDIAMVFQNYALYPHMTVYENMAFGLKLRHVDPQEIDRKVKEAAEILDITQYLDRKPKALSGGQRQRVAIGRAIVRSPKVFLMDEPLSNLDAQLRLRARKELVKIHEMYRPTMVYVTHDQIEAMTVGQRVAIMYRGNMEMLDTPSHVYNMPASIFCARFIGSPSMNIISCQYENGNLSIGDQMIRLALMWRPIADACPSGKYCVGIRPEHIVLSSRPTETSICGTVKYVEDYGNRYGVYIDVKGEKSELIAICNDSVPRPGENIFMNIDFRKLHLFDAQSEKSLGYPEEIRRLNAALDFSMPDAQNKNQKAGGKYHESFGQYQCV